MVTVSAPGKILWMGGYSIIEANNLGFVTSIDKRVYADATALPFPHIELKNDQLGIDCKGIYKNNKNILNNETEQKKVKFIRDAVQFTLNYLEQRGVELHGIKIKTKSDAAFNVDGAKSGLGSSAAVTVATVGAVLSLHGIDLTDKKEIEMLHKIAQYSHCTSQGKAGSGFDVATSTYGSIQYSRYSPEFIKMNLSQAIASNWNYSITPVNLPSFFYAVVANIPNNSTSTTQMVAKVKEFKEKNKVEYSKLISELNEYNKKAIKCLEVLQVQRSEEKLAEFEKCFDDARTLLKTLGEKSSIEIESNQMTQFIEESKKHGAFTASLPGAGGGDSIAGLCLSQTDAVKLKSFWTKSGLELLDISIDNTGVKLETSVLKRT